jgi:hypothetical protein
MSAYHKRYPLEGSNSGFLWALYQHLTNASNNAIEIYNDGVRDVVCTDGTNYGTPTSAASFSTGGFIVVQASFPNPSAISGTAQAGAASTITLDATHNEADDYYIGNEITITGGTGSGQTRVISDYVNATDVATVSAAWSPNPDNTSTYDITRRWQGKIRWFDSNSMTCEGSPNGGFLTASASSGGTDGFNGNPTTGAKEWTGSFTPGSDDSVYISTDDSDTYDGGAKKYGWLRMITRETGIDPADDSLFIGGYIPFDITNDTDPFVMLVRGPELQGSETFPDNKWGTGDTGSLSRIAVEDGKATTSMVSNGYAHIGGGCDMITQEGMSLTRAGEHMEVPVFLHGQSGLCVGYFGSNTMVGISRGMALWSRNAAGDRLAVNDLGMAWTE